MVGHVDGILLRKLADRRLGPGPHPEEYQTVA